MSYEILDTINTVLDEWERIKTEHYLTDDIIQKGREILNEDSK